MSKVQINVTNGNIGKVDDLGNGVGGLILLVDQAPATHGFGKVFTYCQYEDLPEEFAAIEACKLYFKLAQGRKVFIMPVKNTTTVKTVVDSTTSTAYAKKLIAAANGDMAFLGVVGSMPHTDVQAAVTNAQVLYEEVLRNYSPCVIVLPVTYNATLPDLTQGSADAVAVVNSAHGDEVGLLIGRLAATPVQRHPGRVKDGSMPIIDAEVGNKLIDEAPERVNELVEKGYVSLGVLIGKSGYYFYNANTATELTSDYCNIMNRRVMDKAVRVAYQVYVNELNDELAINDDGTLSPSVVKYFEGLIDNALGAQMVANGNISNAKAFVDEKQNVLQTGKLTVEVKLLLVGYSEEIIVNMGFAIAID